MTLKELIQQEIEKLPDDALSEVFDFIQFLELKQERSLLTQGAQKLSAPTLHKVWDNTEDSIYDNI